MIKAFQLRAARACLNISQADLARETDNSTSTINRLEMDQEFVELAKGKTLMKIIGFFERNGVEFLNENKEREKGAGLRFTQSLPKDQN